MKQSLAASLSALFAASLAFPAVAADLPSRKAAPVYAPPVATWTGFYAGLNAGYNAGTNGNASMANYAGPWRIAPGGGYVNYGAPGAPVGNWYHSSTAVFGSGVGFCGWHGDCANGAPGIILPFATLGSSGGGGGGLLGAAGSDRNTQFGFIGGGQVGYNYQYGSSIVLGIEADIQGAGIRGTTTGSGASQNVLRTPLVGYANAGTITSGVSFASVQGGVDWLGTVRGRLGYLATPTLLLYGTGGLAYGNAWANVALNSVEHHFATTDLTSVPGLHNETSSWLGGGHQNQLLTGWTAGGGLEWMFMQNWSLKAEALYWDLGQMNVATVAYGVTGKPSDFSNNIGWGRTRVSYQGVQAKAGVNYHFTWATAPVVASY